MIVPVRDLVMILFGVGLSAGIAGVGGCAGVVVLALGFR